MDDAKREALKARRAALQAERKTERLETIRGSLGAPSRLLAPEDCKRLLKLIATAPARDERILWTAVPGGTCHAWDSDEERDALAAEALAICAGGDGRVAVIWSPHEGGLELAAADAPGEFALLLEQGLETRIVDAGGGLWLIECSLVDREICYFRTPLWSVG